MSTRSRPERMNSPQQLHEVRLRGLGGRVHAASLTPGRPQPGHHPSRSAEIVIPRERRAASSECRAPGARPRNLPSELPDPFRRAALALHRPQPGHHSSRSAEIVIPRERRAAPSACRAPGARPRNLPSEPPGPLQRAALAPGIREGGFCDFPAANSFAPGCAAGTRFVRPEFSFSLGAMTAARTAAGPAARGRASSPARRDTSAPSRPPAPASPARPGAAAPSTAAAPCWGR